MKSAFYAIGSGILLAVGNLQADTTTLSGFSDTYLVMNKDSTPETQPLLIVEGYHCSACIDQRVLIKFDLAGFARDAFISKAELKLYSPSQPRPGSAIVRVYRMEKYWAAAEANWNNATKAVKWANKGGDFEAKPGASLEYNDQINVWHTYNITDIIKGFVADPASNFGIMLLMDPAMKTVAYVSSDAPQSELQPKLLIEFTSGSAAISSRRTVGNKLSDFRIVDFRARFSFADAGEHRILIGRLDGAVFFNGTVIGAQPVLPLNGISAGTYFVRTGSGTEHMQRAFSIVGP